MGSQKVKYFRELLESKSSDDLFRILCDRDKKYSKEIIGISREILRKRGELNRDRRLESRVPTRGTNLVWCPDCGKEVSKRAEKCPYCGAPVKKIMEWRGLWKSIPKWAWVAFGVIFVLLIVIATVQESERRSAEIERQQTLKQQAEAREQQAKERRKTEARVEQRSQESMSNAKELLDRMVSRGGAISGFWSQRGSAWIKVPANWANNRHVCKEYAEVSAKFLSSQLGYTVCVHLYYGDQNEIASACR